MGFHNLMRGGACYLYGSVVWGRTVNTSKGQIQTNDFELRDFILYMSVHFILCTLAIFVLGYCCLTSKILHQILLFFVLTICVYRGATRYTYYTTKMYGKMLRKEFGVLSPKKSK